MSGPRFRCPNLMFRIPGRPMCSGGKSPFGAVRTEKLLSPKVDKKTRIQQKNELQARTKAQYENIVAFIAKSAMAQSGWTKTNEPLYIVITFYINYPFKKAKADIDKIYSEDVPAVTGPKLPVAFTNYTKWLEGVVYEKSSQIVGSLVLKRYTKGEEHTDFLIGKPNDYGDIVYDIRNN